MLGSRAASLLVNPPDASSPTRMLALLLKGARETILQVDELKLTRQNSQELPRLVLLVKRNLGRGVAPPGTIRFGRKTLAF